MMRLAQILFVFLLKSVESSFEHVVKDILETRIVLGLKAEEGQFPFMASIVPLNPGGGKGNCAGSVISENYVLTAAHCIHKYTHYSFA